MPPVINAKTLRKLSLASNNESYLINILNFLRIVGDDDKPTKEASTIFNAHPDDKFREKFSSLVSKAYNDLFDTHGQSAWELNLDELISYFREADQSTATVGRLQARTFQILSDLCGHANATQPISSVVLAKKKGSRAKAKAATHKSSIPKKQGKVGAGNVSVNDFGLTVRIEINLPVSDDKKTYDNIFKSIRENLIDA